jgi:hypothetical protein
VAVTTSSSASLIATPSVSRHDSKHASVWLALGTSRHRLNMSVGGSERSAPTCSSPAPGPGSAAYPVLLGSDTHGGPPPYGPDPVTDGPDRRADALAASGELTFP